MEAKIYPPDFEKNGKSLFTGVDPGKVSKYVIFTVRDPLHGFTKDAAEEISEFMDNSKKIADTRMFTTYTGEYKSTPITICSTGSGAPEVEIALMDFIKWTNADTFIRVGTSGSLQNWVNVGDIVITSAAVRDEGTSEEYVKPIYPAVSSYEVVLSFATAAEKLNFNYHIGITRSNDAIYVGEGRPVCGYIQDEHEKIPEYWEKARVLNVEREVSLILTICNIFGKRGGAVCTVVDNELTGELGIGVAKKESILTVLEGIKKLSEWDRIKEKNGKTYLYEDIIKER